MKIISTVKIMDTTQNPAVPDYVVPVNTTEVTDLVGIMIGNVGVHTIVGVDDASDCTGFHVFADDSKPVTDPCTAADRAEVYAIVETYTGIQPTNAAFLAATSGTVQQALEYAYPKIRMW